MDENLELEYYRIDLGQIWRIEAFKFLQGNGSLEFIEKLKQRYEELVIKAFLNQSKVDNSVKQSYNSIEPFVSHKSMDAYSIRQLRKYRNCKSLIDFIKLGFFPYKNDFFTHEQTIFITPLLSDFEFWFAIRLKHYESGYKLLESFLDYNLELLFHSDFDRFLKSLNLVLIQNSKGYFSENLIAAINSWINNNRNNSFKQGIVTWDCELFLSHNELVKNGTRVNTEINLDYKTFLIQKYFDDQSIFDSRNYRFTDFVEIFMQLKDHFFHHKTKFDSFTSLFKPAVIPDENKLIWVGTYFELKKFIKAIDQMNICNHLSGVAKWQIGMFCFKIQVNKGTNKGDIINIESAKKISDASGKNSERCDRIFEIVTKLKTTIESSSKS